MSIRETIEINRPPEDVFAYASDPAHMTEWQEGLVETHAETEGPPRVGSRMKQTRRVGGGTRTFTIELTAYEPPSRASAKGVDGPVRPQLTITLEPLDDGQRTRYSSELDFEGHGLGVLLVPLVRRQASREMPRNLQHLKEKLEA